MDDGVFFMQCYEELCLKKQDKLSQKLADRKAELVEKLDVIINSLKGDQGAVFVKTSCRSAKDTTLYSVRFNSAFEAALSKATDNSLNSKMIALLQAGTEALTTYEAQGLFDTFLISERVYQDFELAVARKERWEQNLAVRRWTPMDVDMEFRGYVKDHKLTAVSQYNYVAYFPRLVEMRAKLEETITKFFYSTCLPALSDLYSEFIIDFGIVGENFDKILVIELNEFMDTTDGCMFKWATERHLLENEPLTFRLVEKPFPEDVQEAFLSPEWKKLVGH